MGMLSGSLTHDSSAPENEETKEYKRRNEGNHQLGVSASFAL